MLLLLPLAAFGQRDSTRDSLDRMEESLQLRMEEGKGLNLKELVPAIVVSTMPAFEETRAWFPAAALSSLVKVFGSAGLRSCEGCRAPRVRVEDGRIEQSIGPPGTAEIIKMDEMARGKSAPARSAIFLDESVQGVSLRIIDLRNSRVIMAENFDPTLWEPGRTRRNLVLAKELDRRNRNDSITHAFVDIGIFPHQHIGLDWTEQWGDNNNNLSGVTITLFDPLIGIGANYYRVLPFALNLMVGAQLVVSIPTAFARALSPNIGNLFDPPFTGVFVVRLPFGRSNFGICLTVSTNARVALGLSLLNVSLLPFLP